MKYFKHLLKILISGLLIFFLFKKINIDDFYAALLEIKLRYLLISLLIFIFCWFINSKKWQWLLAHLGFTEKIWKLFRLNLASIFYASILPGGQLTGEAIKCYKITKNREAKGELIYSVFLDRITGLIAFIILGFFGILATKSSISNAANIKLFFFICLLGSLFFLLLFNFRLAEKLQDKIMRLNNGRIKQIMIKITNLLFIYRGAYRILLISLALGLVFQFFNTLSMYFLTLAFSLKISILDLFWINALVSLILVLPVTILGLGLREGSFVVFFGALGVSSARALSFSLLASAVYFLTGIFGGLFELYDVFKNKKSNLG